MQFSQSLLLHSLIQNLLVVFFYLFHTLVLYKFYPIKKIQGFAAVPYFADVEGGESEKVSLKSSETVRILLNAEELKRLEIWPQIPLKTRAPIAAEQHLGTLEYRLDGEMLKKVALYTEYAVPEQSILSKLTGMLTNLSDTN